MAKKKLFKFAKRNTPLIPKDTRSVRAQKIPNEADDPPYFIRGQQADSKEEWWCSLALDRIQEETGWTWDYQVSVFGGRTRAGGNVVDFLIDTPVQKTILDPMGRYWHTGINEDQNEMQNVARRKGWRLVAWFTDETPTREIMYTFLRDKLNV